MFNSQLLDVIKETVFIHWEIPISSMDRFGEGEASYGFAITTFLLQHSTFYIHFLLEEKNDIFSNVTTSMKELVQYKKSLSFL